MYLIIFLIFLLIVLFTMTQVEAFTQFGDFMIFRDFINITLDQNGRPIDYSYNTPPENGKSGCAIIPCPDHFKERVVCWSCCNYF